MTLTPPTRDPIGSWQKLRAMFDRLETRGDLADWNSPEEYKSSRSTKSVTMASLVRELQPIYSERTIAGIGIFGVVISINPALSQLNNHVITLRVGPDKRIQVGLMVPGQCHPKDQPVEFVHCCRENVCHEVDRFLQVLIAEANA